MSSTTLAWLLILAGAPADAPRELAYAKSLEALAAPGALRSFHDLLGSEPHVAGTPGDARTIERIAQAFTDMGLETRIEPFWALLPVPVDAKLEIVSSEGGAPAPAPAPGSGGSPRRGVIPLSLIEDNLLNDPSLAHPGLSYGWNAYSGSGDITAEVVYAGFGNRADFARLREMGVDCKGKIVLIRYGKLFRGVKVKFAEEAGAAGVLLYTDPADSGDTKGPVWPDGGWANPSCIQRGCIMSLEQPGDPLTPFIPATPDAKRLDPDSVGLPTIPVQPIGYAAAAQIVSRMRGAELDEKDPWRGGMPVTYRVTGGPELKLRLMVKQDRPIQESANVIGVIKGSEFPESAVIVGCHHDAWGFGAADPLAGTIVLMEMARACAELAMEGRRPARTIIFAAWGAEEYGIIGSVEWVEAHREAIASSAVAYINLDMAAMGPRFGASVTPSLRSLVKSVIEGVPTARDPGTTIADEVRGRNGGNLPEFSDIAGGSDHVGFACHLAVPCIGLGAGGSPGDSYHSNYDTLAWYRATVGDDYEPALMLTRVGLGLVARLADAPVLPQRVESVGRAIVRWSEQLKAKAPDESTKKGLESLRLRGEAIAELGARLDPRLDASSDSMVAQRKLNLLLMSLDRAWYCPTGLTGRAWFRNLAAASDRDSAYAALSLPLIAEALESGDPERIASAIDRTADAIDRLAEVASGMDAALAGFEE